MLLTYNKITFSKKKISIELGRRIVSGERVEKVISYSVGNGFIEERLVNFTGNMYQT